MTIGGGFGSMEGMDIKETQRIGELLANGTAPTVICKALGVDISVLHESVEIQRAISRAVLSREQVRVTTGRKLRALKEKVVDELEGQLPSATPGELTGLLVALDKVKEAPGDQNESKGRTVKLVVNNVLAPHLQITGASEIISLNGKSIVPATGESLDDIIAGTEGTAQEAME